MIAGVWSCQPLLGAKSEATDLKGERLKSLYYGATQMTAVRAVRRLVLVVSMGAGGSENNGVAIV